MKQYDVVEAMCALPAQHVEAGQRGTIVEVLDNEHMLVEFANEHGVACALVPMHVQQLTRSVDDEMTDWENMPEVGREQDY